MIEPTLNTGPATASNAATVRREAGQVTALFHGHTIASSRDVLVCDGQRYFPRADVGLSFLRAVDTAQDARGTATRYTVYRDGEVIENGAWSYDAPTTGYGDLTGRIAFRDDLVRYDVSPLDGAAPETRSWDTANEPSQRDGAPDAAPLNTRPAGVDEIVRHTDSGSGSSQAERWAPNVEGPDAVEPGATDRPYRDAGSI